MREKINYGRYQVPLLIAKKRELVNELHMDIDRYAGVAFFIGENGRIVTCKHIVEMVQEDEMLLGQNLITGEIAPISNLKLHPTYDFATGNFSRYLETSVLELDEVTLLPGEDVRVFGFTNIGQKNNIVRMNARMLKGYVVSQANTSEHPHALTTTELSFPSLKGFSGSPLLSEETGKVVGMMFSNHESSIEIHSITDIEENGEKFSEQIHRIIELGLAHSSKDLISFLRDIEYGS